MNCHAAPARPGAAPAAPGAAPAPAAPGAAPAPALTTDAVGTTSLAELNAAAGLLTRVDRKYLVPLDDTQRVVDAVADRSRVLEIDGRRGFAYASTYFDTPALDCYLLSARKRRRRFKVRTRSYLDSGLTFLEVKTRGPRGATVKKRVPYSPDDADRLTPAGRDFVTACLIESGTGTGDAARRLAAALVPVMGTTYERTTLHLPDDEARATIDTDLVWTPLDTEGRRCGESREAGALAVVETKNPATPSPTDRLLWSVGHRPGRVSKYATGMALLHPELPANKWHRVMSHDLAV
ncbi:polyphosphate polymerase domain-containing protein [Actinomyces radicidentis]|uniref:polyphosphate polymerase domain-containing protein n=1 Tax=Actinomyces radicidentis TaxID=111015 RepID=UPI0028E4EA4B|nr:polyphosphate polymerase domain-containing protein [Actinomyces radicidentis]